MAKKTLDKPAARADQTRNSPAHTASFAQAGLGAGTAASVGDLNASGRLQLLRSMVLQRRFEEKCAEAYALGKIGGFCHLYIGQEAISAGSMSLLRDDDYIVTAYRDHGLALARGLSARSVMAELFGRATGCSGGKGGSMHLFDASRNFLGGHGIVGGHIPLAAGVGYAIKYRGGDQVCLCFFGEAAVNIGSFHEALNMAALWKLPVIFVIENNGYGMGTAITRAMSKQDVIARGAAYGMDSESVDAQDVFKVREVMGRAIERARAEHKPTLLEMRTTRFMGHSMSDAASGTYRPKEELEADLRTRDPIVILRGVMTRANELTDDAYNKMDEEIKAEVQDSWDFADNSPEPSPEALFTNILTDTTSDDLEPATTKGTR
jgi:pyruvate dehydrogenase E1 component alpha subunit